MHRIVLHHLSGSKANQVEEIPIERARDLLVGRDPAAQVRYDPDRDDLVSGQHARILQDPQETFRFSIVDLNSRNGTFVNRQRVVGTATISSGDLIQLGPGGPEFRFEIDPPPPGQIKTTREAPSAGAPLPRTRESSVAGPPGASKVGIGAETLERRVTEAKREARRGLSIGLAATIVLLVGIGGVIAWRMKVASDEAERNKPWTPDRTAAEFSSATVLIEMAWKLVFRTGEQIFQEYVIETTPKGEIVRDARGNPRAWPTFERLSNGKIIPRLTIDAGSMHENHPISCGGTGSGFAVTTDGFIITNRHVATNWESRYNCFPAGGKAVLYAGGKGQIVPDIGMLNLDWVPAEDGREIKGKRFEGQNTYLDVTFKLNKLRFPATVARVSDRHDAALIKIQTPQTVKKVEMLDSYNTIAVGNTVTVMGYPGVSPDIAVNTPSFDPLARDSRVTVVPDTTVTPGSIGRVIRGQMKATQGTTGDYLSGFGDTYQLTINATGSGNSGGPVFDDHGHVIGIYTYGNADASGTRISFAVPIKYAIELLGTSPAVVSGSGQ
jgi:serine protease Do